MVIPSAIDYKQAHSRLWPPPKGPVVTLVVMLISEVISHMLGDIPVITPLFLTIVYAALCAGSEAGLMSALLTICYALYSFGLPGQFLHYTNDNLIRVLIITMSAPLLAVLVGIFKRRADREQAEAKRMQQYQTLLLQSVNDAIISTDAHFRIQTWNRASEIIYGWSAAEVQGKPIGEIFGAMRYAGGYSTEHVLAVLHQQSHWKGQLTSQHRDGHEILIEASVQAIRDSDTAILGYVTVNRDITEQHRAEAERNQLLEQLQTERVRFETVLRQMPAGVLIAEAPSGRLVLGNQQLAHILRHPFLPAADVAQYDQYQGFHADGRPYQPEEWPLARSIRAGAVITNEEIEVRRGDGTLGTICTNSAPIYDRHGSIIAGVATFCDITEQKRDEQSQRFLAQAGSILTASLDYESTLSSIVRLIIPHLADWCTVHLLDDTGKLLRPAVAHRDVALEELIRTIQQSYPIDPHSNHPIIQVLRTGVPQLVPQTDGTSFDYAQLEADHRAALDTLGFKGYMIVPLVARGRTLGAATFVSARRCYTPHDLAEAEEIMRRCGLAVDNARLYQAAQQAVATRDQLMTIVSHDLKNPLSAIKGYATLMQRRITRLAGPEKEWLNEGLSKIDSNTEKMTTLLDEILDFARRQAGQRLDLRPTDLVALATQTVVEYQQATEQHQLSVKAAVPSLVGQYDTARLERVLANLLSNAIKYSPHGGPITVEVAQSLEAPEPWAIISVRDHGLGIPAADLPLIFEPFQRARNVVGQAHGSGIGLTSARQIVEQHGGTLTAASIEGAGSTFTMRLPLVIAPLERPSPSAAS
jgi:PAS domain S-box-containing protein